MALLAARRARVGYAAVVGGRHGTARGVGCVAVVDASAVGAARLDALGNGGYAVRLVLPGGSLALAAALDRIAGAAGQAHHRQARLALVGRCLRPSRANRASGSDIVYSVAIGG